MARKSSPGAVRRFEIRGKLDRAAVEAVRLEVRRLAKRHGVDIREFRVETVDRREGRSA